MRKFIVLLKKELRELITPQLIIPMVAVVIIFNMIGNVLKTQSRAEKSLGKKVAVMDLDNSELSRTYLKELQGSYEVVTVEKDDVVKVFKTLENINSLLVIPEGLEKAVEQNRKFTLEVYDRVMNLSMKSLSVPRYADNAFRRIRKGISDAKLSQNLPKFTPKYLKFPVEMEEHVVLGNRSAKIGVDDIHTFFMQQSSFIPMILFLVIFLAAQMLSTAIATEKEDKTLETLLSAPVSRSNIVSAKMAAAALVSFLLVVFYMVGFQNYASGIYEDSGLTEMAAKSMSKIGALTELGMTLTLNDKLMLGLVVFMGILCALALAVILSSFAENAKSVHGLITPLMVLVMFPFIMIQFLDLTKIKGAVKALIYLNPFSYPFLATPSLLMDDHALLTKGVAYMIVFFLALMVIAAKIFSSDLIITMKINFRKKPVQRED